MKRLIVILILLISACLDSSDNERTLKQEEIDNYTAYMIMETLSQIQNINLAGRPVGSVNMETSCPNKGSVTITGSTGYSQSTDITTVDLTFQLKECEASKHTADNSDLYAMLTGLITLKGSFRKSDGYDATNYQSESLDISMSISVTGYKTAEVKETCRFTSTVTNNTVSGTICGRNFSY